MPDLQLPRSDIDRLALLERVHKTSSDYLAAGEAMLDQSLIEEVAAFLVDYKPMVNAVKSKLSDRVREVEERKVALTDLEQFIRDFYAVLKRRIRRNKESVGIWQLYGLDSSGTLPDPRTGDSLLQWGERIVNGEVQAVAAGYPAMSNPSAAEVEAILTQAKAEMADVPMADLAYDQAQKAVAAKREQADKLIRRVSMLLDYQLFDQDPPNTRRIKRNFGFSYVYQVGETIEEKEN